MKLLFTLLFSLFVILSYSQTDSYVNYHQLITKAEFSIIESKEDALELYEVAFRQFKPFDVDVLNFLILKTKEDVINLSAIDSLLRLYIIKSENDRQHYLKLFSRNAHAIVLRDRIQVVEVVEDEGYLRDQQFMDSIMKIDQRIRNPVIWFFLGDRKADLKDSLNFVACNKHFFNMGHPSVVKGPVDDLTIHYLHNPHRLREVELLDLVFTGKLHPNSFAYIIWRMEFIKIGSTTEANKYGCKYFVKGMSDEQLRLADENRGRIGLPSIQESGVLRAIKTEYGMLTQF